MTNAQYRTANEASAELKVIEAQIHSIFIRYLGNAQSCDEVIENIDSASSSVRKAIEALDELVEEGGDIYNDVEG